MITQYRHLIGVPSPPSEMICDDVLLTPQLLPGWYGDSWRIFHRNGPDKYFLRAWNIETGHCATARGPTFEEAKKAILAKIEHGSTNSTILPKRTDMTTIKASVTWAALLPALSSEVLEGDPGQFAPADADTLEVLAKAIRNRIADRSRKEPTHQ